MFIVYELNTQTKYEYSFKTLQIHLASSTFTCTTPNKVITFVKKCLKFPLSSIQCLHNEYLNCEMFEDAVHCSYVINGRKDNISIL